MSDIERRRIVWDASDAGNLDPFVIDESGRVFNGSSREPAKVMSPGKAANIWRDRHRGRGLRSVDSSQPGALGKRIPDVTGDQLVCNEVAEIIWDSPLDDVVLRRVDRPAARWLHRSLAPSPVWSSLEEPRPSPRIEIAPPEYLPLVGDPTGGWVVIVSPGRVASLLHGPSVAAFVFDRRST